MGFSGLISLLAYGLLKFWVWVPPPLLLSAFVLALRIGKPTILKLTSLGKILRLNAMNARTSESKTTCMAETLTSRIISVGF